MTLTALNQLITVIVMRWYLTAVMNHTSDVAGDSDEEAAQAPPSKKGTSKAVAQQQPVFTWKDAPIQP